LKELDMTEPAIPSHLPRRLAICSWIWSWITSALPDEPYGDLERAMSGLRERGFNAVRLEAGLNWCFRQDGSPRGPVEFGQFIPGYSDNFRGVNARGGGKHNVLERFIRMMELAKAYNIYVLPTSWEYQDSSWFLADRALRAEVMAIPVEERIMRLARHHDRLLQILKQRGLERNLAFVEILNEAEFSLVSVGPEGKRQWEQAVSFLRGRHPDIMFSSYLGISGNTFVPDNVQVYNQHPYFGISFCFEEIYGPAVWDNAFDPLNPRALPLFARLCKEKVVPFDTFMAASQNVREFWRKIGYLFHNVDPARYDEYVLSLLPKWDSRFRESLDKQFAQGGAAAKRANLPIVVDEGGFFTAPLNSRFEEMPEGLKYFDYSADLAIRHNYWGFLPTTYCGPEMPLWRENPRWLREINSRFVAGQVL
jgi:hypothetical protein